MQKIKITNLWYLNKHAIFLSKIKMPQKIEIKKIYLQKQDIQTIQSGPLQQNTNVYILVYFIRIKSVLAASVT